MPSRAIPIPPPDGDVPHPGLYPGLHHFRVIVEAGNVPWDALHSLLAPREVTAPLTAGNRSGSGKYLSLQVSILVRSRDELEQIHAEIRAVPGVRMLL